MGNKASRKKAGLPPVFCPASKNPACLPIIKQNTLFREIGRGFFGRQSPSAQAQNVKKRCKATVSGCFTPRRQPSVGCRPMDRRRFAAGHRFPAITGTGRKGDPPSGRIKGKSSGVFFSAPPDTQPRKLAVFYAAGSQCAPSSAGGASVPFS